MISTAVLAAAVMAKAVSGKAFEFCKDAPCKECPVSVTDVGTGYPHCVVYETDRVLPNQGFPDGPGGGIAPYLNIEQPDETCAVIVRSPANTDHVDCGVPIGSFKHPTCVQLDLKKTFMVQFCCGHDDCQAAGANGKRSAKFSPKYSGLRGRGSGSGAVYLQRPDGSIIEPIDVGKPKSPAEIQAREDNVCNKVINMPSKWDVIQGFHRREDKGRCNKDWKGTDPYTKPSEHTQIVANNIESSASCTITVKQEWTTTIDAGLTLADIFSLGVSQSFNKGYSTTISQTVTVEKGQHGDWGWTAIMECSKGSGTCDGKKVEGEICWPKMDENGQPVGDNRLILH